MTGSKRVFITGGASGLGRALAERYARSGWRVAFGDVNEERSRETLAALKALSPEAHYLPCDVTRDDALTSARDWLERNWGGVDVVYNNAGVAVSGRIDEVPLTDWQWVVDINLLGVVRGCHVFTQLFKKQGHGHLVNVASLAGLVHAPGMAPYNATKAGVVALSETLAAELSSHGIGVSVVCPWFFRTNLIDTARSPDPELLAQAKRLVTKAPRGADVIAEYVVRAVERGEFRILPDNEGRSAWRLKRLLPFSMFSKLLVRTMAKS